MDDNDYMDMALELAKKGYGKVNPNPLVGAVVVKDDVVIGQGYHEIYGGLHGERNALNQCKVSPAGATLYVTLEPCCHWGITAPCTTAIIEHKIAKVVVGSRDPNPLVAGKGLKLLREHKVDVVEGVKKKECDQINAVFFHYIKTKTPYVVMKYAMTMDGKIATCNGHSQWITGELARQKVQEDRNKYMAIMVGIKTVLTDDPLLTCRMKDGRNPIRIVCDTQLITPLESNIIMTAKEVPTIIATCSIEKEKQAPYLFKGCAILEVKGQEGHLDLSDLMKKLGEKKIDSILLEGGSTLNWSMLKLNKVNKIQAYIAPMIFGGTEAKSPIGGKGVAEINEAIKLVNSQVIKVGEDILIESEVVSCLPG